MCTPIVRSALFNEEDCQEIKDDTQNDTLKLDEQQLDLPITMDPVSLAESKCQAAEQDSFMNVRTLSDAVIVRYIVDFVGIDQAVDLKAIAMAKPEEI